MSRDDANLVWAILDGFGVLFLEEEFISCFRRGDFGAVKKDFPNALAVDAESGTRLDDLEAILKKHRGTEGEASFWADLRTKQVSPVFLATLAFGLLAKESDFYNHGLILYTILLGMEPATTVWNPVLFHPILAHLIRAQQILEAGGQLNASTKDTLELAHILLVDILFAFTQRLAELIDREVLVAFAEITVKLTTGMRVEFDSINTAIGDSAAQILGQLAESHLEFLLPFLVPALLLQFAGNTTSFTTRLERIRERLLRVATEHIPPEDPNYLNFCKHLIVRAPEKAHLRRSAVTVVAHLIERCKIQRPIIHFVLKLTHSSRVSNRAFGTQLIVQFLVDIEKVMKNETEIIPELTMEIGNILKIQLGDVAPTVRAAALEGIGQIAGILDCHVCSEILKQTVDLHGSLLKILAIRTADEKLIVRRAAVSCLNEILTHSSDPSPVVVELVASRVRDRATSLRQQAVRVMSAVVDRFPDNEALNSIWLDSILPLIVDPENSVQNEAFDSVRRHIFEPIARGKFELFTAIFSEAHFNFMSNIFMLYKQKAISLLDIAKGLTKGILANPSRQSYWKLIDLLTMVEPSHIKAKSLLEFWPNRRELPAEYFSVLAHLSCQSEGLLDDLLMAYRRNLNENSCEYPLIHAMLLLIRVQIGADDDVWLSLITEACQWINDIVQNECAIQQDLMSLLSPIYALGVLVMDTQSPKELLDFDMRGIEILLAEQMPNHVAVPSAVRSMASIALGKLCLQRQDIARSNVSIFVHQLTTSSDAPLKCDCLICLCDLCVRYSALVDDHISVMTNSLADESPMVRRQTLHIVTRLVAEGYMKMRTILFLKFVWALTDPVESVASFARCCLFNVLVTKHPDLITAHFIEAIYYFSREVGLPGFDQTEEEAALFLIENEERRRTTWDLLIAKFSDAGLYSTIEAIFNHVFTRFLSEELDMRQHAIILADAIYVLVRLEDMRRSTIEAETLTDDSAAEICVEAAKKILNEVHTKTISTILPILNRMHQLLRHGNSPLQSQLNIFYRCICEKNPALLAQVEKSEPLLAAELKVEMSKSAADDGMVTPPGTPNQSQPFSSPLLAHIASTPRTLLCSPSPAARGNHKRARHRREFSTPEHADHL
jgi:hypothetical protein